MIHEAVDVTIYRDGKEEHRKAVLVVRDKVEMVEQLDRYLNLLVSYRTDGLTGNFIEGINVDGEEIHATVSSQTVSAIEAADMVKDNRVTVLSSIG